MKKKVAILGIVVAILLPAVLATLYRDEVTAIGRSKSAPQGKNSSEGRRILRDDIAGFVGERWPAGNTYRYDFSMESTIRLGGVDGSVDTLRLDGELVLTSVESSETTRLFMLAVNPASAAVIDDENGKNETLAAAFETPVFFSMSGTGAVTEVKVEPNMPAIGQSTAKSILGMMQFVGPEAVEESWETEESDTTGRYVAAYERQGRIAFHKEKLRYLVGDSKKGTKRGAARILASSSTFDWKDDGPLDKLDVDETVTTDSSEMFPDARVQTRFQLTLKESRPMAASAATLREQASTFAATTLFGPTTKEARQAVMDKTKIAGMDWNAALTLLDKHSGDDNASEQKRYRVFVGLEALLRREAGALASAKAHILENQPQSRLILEAMGYSGSPETQQAIVDLLEESDAHPLRNIMLRSLSNAAEPTEANVRAHKRYMKDPELARQALYGLGDNAYKLGGMGKRDLAADAGEILVEQLEKADSIYEQMVVLRAIGNSGYLGALEAVTPFLTHELTKLRVEGLNALRRMPGEQVDQILVENMLSAQEAQVRVQAERMIEYRTPSPVIAMGLDRAVKTELDITIKKRIVSLLLRNYLPEAVAKETLRWVVDNERNEELVEMAGRAFA